MPLYEYKCEIHGTFEDIRPIRLRFKAPCPKCGMDCDYNPVASRHTVTALSPQAKAELMEVLQHAVPPGEPLPDIHTHGQAREFLVRRGFHPDGIIKTTELARRLGTPIYDHMEEARKRR